jgi:diguanylate cyclase (GGDEF)-like protein/PAS domain S-box-containing protein
LRLDRIIPAWLLGLLGHRPGGAGTRELRTSGGDVDYRLLTENSRDIICRIDADALPVYVSPSIRTVLGWTPEEMIASGTGFIHPEDEGRVRSLNHRLATGQIDEDELTIRMFDKSGRAVWMEANARVVRDAGGAPGDIVIVLRDISVRKRREDELRVQALTDGLTGLCNRRSFDEALDREWQRTVHGGGQISLLMLDVDYFKIFNDLYGHQAGDECLRVIAAAIKAVVDRPTDFVARYGGEEIAIILPGMQAEGALAIAEAVRAAIEALGIHHGGTADDGRTVTVSIGVATAFARNGAATQMPAGLLLAADGALYRAKQNGRNRVVATVLLTAPGGTEAGAS